MTIFCVAKGYLGLIVFVGFLSGRIHCVQLLHIFYRFIIGYCGVKIFN